MYKKLVVKLETFFDASEKLVFVLKLDVPACGRPLAFEKSAPARTAKPRMMMTRKIRSLKTAKKLFSRMPPRREAMCTRMTSVNMPTATPTTEPWLAVRLPCSSLRPAASRTYWPKAMAFPAEVP